MAEKRELLLRRIALSLDAAGIDSARLMKTAVFGSMLNEVERGTWDINELIKHCKRVAIVMRLVKKVG